MAPSVKAALHMWLVTHMVEQHGYEQVAWPDDMLTEHAYAHKRDTRAGVLNHDHKEQPYLFPEPKERP